MKLQWLKLACSLLVLSIPVDIIAESATRPSHFELALPYPNVIPKLVTESNLPYYTLERLIPVILDIDRKGCVTGVAAENLSDSSFANYTQLWLKSIEFEPATFKGKEVQSYLPIIMQFRPKVRLPDLFFPLDTSRSITDADLYFKAFGLNDIRPPQLVQFPSYFCDIKSSDTSVIFKYILTKVTLDESGQVTDVVEVSSTYPAFTQQVMSAILWAKFSPTEVRGTPQPSKCFILVSFFPQISYPTRVWQQDNYDSLYLLERFRVRLLPDTVGLMTKPLPAKLSGSEFTLSGRHTAYRNQVSAFISVDVTGSASLRRMSKTGKEVQLAVRELIGRRLRFYPAMDYQGNPQRFSGLVTFIFKASPKIRMEYNWLPITGSIAQP